MEKHIEQTHGTVTEWCRPIIDAHKNLLQSAEASLKADQAKKRRTRKRKAGPAGGGARKKIKTEDGPVIKTESEDPDYDAVIKTELSSEEAKLVSRVMLSMMPKKT